MSRLASIVASNTTIPPGKPYFATSFGPSYTSLEVMAVTTLYIHIVFSKIQLRAPSCIYIQVLTLQYVPDR
ncbi:hypothetical protein GYMLUDRAFT_885290 [Collybiopsis luxurians FD-317 M1]|uniref:Uncharacterized protein n=1 Tax=Collybiopsis luxurians FD-317 M1 TaxID=944289 RepID=A0A0D0CAV7_9AGAR|nr:hypothetical protein GYMLUDRAFT_885290 [Collybiopsis luxurians FD-317 M1]